MVRKVALYFKNHFKNWSRFIRVFSFKSTSGSFDETMLFTVVVSASRRSSLILLVVELTKKQRGNSLVEKAIRCRWKSTQRYDKHKTPKAGGWTRSELYQLFQSKMVSNSNSHFQCELRCVLLWRPVWIDMKLTDFLRLFGGRVG